MAIEIVDFPIKNGDFPWQNVSSPEGNLKYPLVMTNIAMVKIPYKWRVLAGKIIYKWAMASMAMLNNQRVCENDDFP